MTTPKTTAPAGDEPACAQIPQQPEIIPTVRALLAELNSGGVTVDPATLDRLAPLLDKLEAQLAAISAAEAELQALLQTAQPHTGGRDHAKD